MFRYTISRAEFGEERERAGKRAAAAAVLRRLDTRENDEDDEKSGGSRRRQRKEDLVLNQYEQMVALDVVAPEDIPTRFEGQ